MKKAFAFVLLVSVVVAACGPAPAATSAPTDEPQLTVEATDPPEPTATATTAPTETAVPTETATLTPTPDVEALIRNVPITVELSEAAQSIEGLGIDLHGEERVSPSEPTMRHSEALRRIFLHSLIWAHEPPDQYEMMKKSALVEQTLTVLAETGGTINGVDPLKGMRIILDTPDALPAAIGDETEFFITALNNSIPVAGFKRPVVSEDGHLTLTLAVKFDNLSFADIHTNFFEALTWSLTDFIYPDMEMDNTERAFKAYELFAALFGSYLLVYTSSLTGDESFPIEINFPGE